MSSMQSSGDKDLYYGNYNTMMIYDYLYSTATDSTAHVWFADVRYGLARLMMKFVINQPLGFFIDGEHNSEALEQKIMNKNMHIVIGMTLDNWRSLRAWIFID
jgi:hypothetical protein